MPIRIREVHVKATVREHAPRTPSSTRDCPATSDPQTIVAICVDQVMRKLREKAER